MDYRTKSVKELKQEGSKRKIKYAAKMIRKELIGVLQTNDRDPTYTTDPVLVKVCKDRCQIYIDKNRDRLIEYHRNYQRAYQREWRKKNPEKQAENWEKYWLKKLRAKGILNDEPATSPTTTVSV